MKHLTGEIGWNLGAVQLMDMEPGEEFTLTSYGGDLYEGLAMFDIVKAKKLVVGVVGAVASAATLPLLASKKRWGTPNSRYLIHNPWTYTAGNAEQVEKTAEQLKEEQERLLALYTENISIDRAEIETLLAEDKFIDATEALRIGLITEIKDMAKNTNRFSRVVAFMASALGVKNPLAVTANTADGKEVEFTDVDTIEEVTVGASATIDGASATGEQVMSDGRTFVFSGGKLASIVEASAQPEPASEQEPTPEPEPAPTAKADPEVMAEISTLKAKSAALEAKNAALEARINEMKALQAKFEGLLNNQEKGPAPTNEPTPQGGKKEHKGFTFKRPNQ